MRPSSRPLPTCTPPDAARVFARGLVLAQLGFRASVDLQASHPAAQAHYEELQQWLRTRQFTSEMESSEQGRLAAPLGELTAEELVELSLEFEAAAVMAWALRFLELPAHDHFVRGREVLDALGMSSPVGMEARLAQLCLRPAAEVHVQSRRVHTIHWRLRRHQLVEDPSAGAASMESWRAEAEELGIELVDGELPVDGVPLTSVAEARARACLGAVEPRHRALNWLQGYYLLYSEVPRPSRSPALTRLSA